YRIVVDSENNILLNGDPISDYVFTSPTEMALASLFINLGQGEWTIYGITSDPSDEDTDNDDATDDVDATPGSKNPFANYILYGPESDFESIEKEVSFRKKRYEKKDRIVMVYPVYKNTDFKASWNSMGYDNKGKIAYQIDEVILVSHGVAESNQMSIGVATFSYNKDVREDYQEENGILYRPNELEVKKMNLLYLSSCYSASLSRDWNMSLEFLFSNHYIGKVVGWDGTTKFASSINFSWYDYAFHYGSGYLSEPLSSDYKGEITFIKISNETYEYIWYESVIL
ncbi:MAG: hypothetical protein K6E26_04230, partial [Clostridiales bacterium]|nr:hypothetical protein [Clostridiales bacterium]